MERTAADLKALRELCGLSQQQLADELGVDKRSVKRWESGTHNAPQDAWDAIDRAMAMRDSALEDGYAVIDAPNRANAVTLTYWRSQADYDEHGRDQGYYGVANANARAVADLLMQAGIECRFRYWDGGATRTPGSRY